MKQHKLNAKRITFYLMHSKISMNVIILEGQITEVQISDFLLLYLCMGKHRRGGDLGVWLPKIVSTNSPMTTNIGDFTRASTSPTI